MEAQRRPREEEQRGFGWVASIIAKIPSTPRFSPAGQKAHKQRSHFMAFKMTKIPQSMITPKTGREQSKQNAASETRSKGKERSLSANDGSHMAHSGPDETSIELNGHEPATGQGVELMAAKGPLHSGEASTSATDNCVSITLPTSAPAASTTATAPPAFEKASRKHVKKMAHDCYVDLAHPLPPELERTWDAKIHPWLESNLLHSMDDFNCVSIECVMSKIEDGGPMYPTILVMCRDVAQKASIEVLLKRCSLIPKNIQRRTVVSEILKCTSRIFLSHPPTEVFSGRQVVIHLGDVHTKNSLYANVARIVPSSSDGLSVFCTIGGIISVKGKCYGLTTAHPFAASGNESQETPTATPGYTMPGRVAYAQWPNSAQGEDLQVNPINATYCRGEDWALVEISTLGMTCNTFHVPGVQNPSEVTGYVKTRDLRSGEVWVCAGVSGVQRGFLKHQSASVMMSRSLFSVRSISLERPLVDGDSGSWVVHNDKLCGLIFCRTGNDVGWAYMVPIEAVLESISKYWQSLHPGLPSPEVQVAREEMVDAANNIGKSLPKYGDRPKASVLEAPTFKPSRPSSDRLRKTYEIMPKLRDGPKSPTSEMPKLKLSESSRDEPDLGISPATLSFGNAPPNTKRRGSGLSDDSGIITTFDEHVAWYSNAILSLDDGGVRGYSTLLILDEIMEAIIRREKSYPDSPAESSYHPLVPPTAKLWLPCHYFDYIGGIGSGGLIAIMLGRLKMDVSNTIVASEAVLTEVFKTKQWLPVRAFWFWPREKYDHLILEQEIRQIVRQFAPRTSGCPEISEFPFDENQCKTVVVASRQGEYWEMPYMLRTCKNFSMSSNLGLAHQGPIWQVARATTANPTFFRPAIIDGLKYYQGRSLVLNPTSMMHEEVQKTICSSRNHSVILSIGCGAFSRQNLESNSVHSRMLGVPGYIRLDVDNGLDQMEIDEWRARGRLRTNIGSLIGRYRSKYRRDPTRTKPKVPRLEEPTVKLRPEERRPQELRPHELRPHELRPHEFGHEEMFTRYEQPLYRSVPFFTPDSLTSSVSPQKENQTSPKQAAPQDQEPHLTPISPENMSSVAVAVNNESNIPKWFRPKNVTTEAIRKHTRKYLDREDVRSRIKKIADLLVEKRRDRVRSDPERWEKFCSQTCYRCVILGCPRAGKDYYSRGALQRHILDIHADRFSEEDQGRLEAALDQGQIREVDSGA